MIYSDNLLKCLPQGFKSSLGKAGLTNEEVQKNTSLRLEKDLQKDAVGYLKIRGVRQILCPRTDKRTTFIKGWPDLTFCYNGIPCAFEAKSKTGVLSEDQIKIQADLILDGWNVKVFRSIEELKALLDAMTT